jgi:microcystin degradation protein MlrC
MRDLEAVARALEASAGHWEVGVAAGFAHADTPDTGVSFWVVSDRPEIVCHRSLESLVVLARSFAREPGSEEWELSAALEAIARERRFPALLVEPADNIGGGAPGDATVILEALLKRPLGRCGVVLNAPAVVADLAGIPVGQSVFVTFGGNGWAGNSRPLKIEGTLLRRTDGAFDLEDWQSHLASMAGTRIEMGPCAVVVCGHVTILLTSRPTPPFDLGQWRSQGIDPASLEIIAVKAAVGHRRAYDAIAASSYTVSTPGPCASDLRRLPYRKLRRPILPLDP